MRGLAWCLVAGALVIAGCGSSDDSAKAPKPQKVAASGGSASTAAGVSAAARPTVATLCRAEGKGKPKRQCTVGLTRLKKGKAKNPHGACKGMSKRKTKGVRGKSPFAVCVTAAAKLMALKSSQGNLSNGSADTGSTTSADDNSDSGASDSSATDGGQGLLCTDDAGNEVPIDSPDVEECTEPADDSPSASDSSSDSSSSDSSDDSGSDDTSTDDTSTDDSSDGG